MRALVWHGKNDVRHDTVPDPSIEDPRDCIVRVTKTAICGSDLHLLDGLVPKMENGDVLGHEFMGEVVEIGSEVRRLKVGDRVVVPFTISCGECWFCQRELYSLCDNTNRTKENAIEAMGHAPAGLFGFSHLLGGYAGGQAEYVRVPHADVGPVKVENDTLSDEKVLFLSDIFPTGYMAAENANIQEGDTVAVWGAGPVGLFAIRSAWMLGAGRVIAIEGVPERIALAKSYGNAEVIDFNQGDVKERLDEMTGGRGPDRSIDAVGAESHGHNHGASIAESIQLHTTGAMDRPHVLSEMVKSTRKGGTLSVPGVYGAMTVFPIGPFMNKALSMNSGQTHVQRYLRPLLERIEGGEIDPSMIITHRGGLEAGPDFYKTFRAKDDGCVKCVMTP
ncbi:zinc-dependent alcohol dehydrogenase [Parvularcula dongshanensis]|uniref:Threonine dehydrogenase-like Zn-dependent dehydrogenase n=1 Tax=Parvularcula dongshanensis TaxID=1173995 RepID=A0A840I276_9PROT|nr:zinc-dependent alcohol dehydrogenase [Parvularcula dongshanensis]MBB4659116.1 threonine dehydrogenase-like Zn-dependent dehydrogenase [Parvularcula dongshanensis]